MKACKDCKFFRRSWLDIEYSKCVAPESNVDPVAGKKKSYCTVNRNSKYSCGLEAKWFVQK